MPRLGRVLGTQIAYQARLLASGRAITIGVGLPVILLIGAHGNHTHESVRDLAGYGAFGLTLTAWNTYGVRLVAAREAGVLKRWRATPLPHACYFLGRILATVVVAGLAGVATVVAGVLLYGTHLGVNDALAALLVFVLGALAWAATATAITAAIPTVEAAAPTMLFTCFPVIIVSGIFGAISEPHWLSTLASYLPAEPLVQALTGALGHTAGHSWFAGRDLVVLAVWAVVGLGIAELTFRWEPHRPTQRRPDRAPRPIVPDGGMAQPVNRAGGGSVATFATVGFDSSVTSGGSAASPRTGLLRSSDE
jgi:ABC-2 type transport system permease protein